LWHLALPELLRLAKHKNQQPASELSPDAIAVQLIKRLDGIPIEAAKNALARAVELLDKTQIVSARTPLLN
jgi:hypothetical protein